MAKFVFGAVLLVAAVTISTAAPAGEFEALKLGAENFQGQEIEEREQHLRFRRDTCEFFVFGGLLGDSACFNNCQSMGKVDGSCIGGICECRGENLDIVWAK